MNKKYSAFTLVEIIIVVAIIGILMAISVPIARYAIQQANNTQHRSAAEQLSTAMIAYYGQNRKYPKATGTGSGVLVNLNTALATGGVLENYLSSGFEGGSDATYYYISQTGTNPQWYLICVSYGGINDETEQGGYCTGDGFGDENSGIPRKELTSEEFNTFIITSGGNSGSQVGSNWVDSTFNSGNTGKTGFDAADN